MKTLSLAALLAALLHVGAGTSVAQPGLFSDPYASPQAGGTMLGIYAVETLHGLRVMGTVEGYSAHGRLLPNDILMRATADNLPVFSISTHDRMEYAKAMIGANRVAAIEFFRPGVGNMYAWMTFELQTNDLHSTLLGIASAGTTFKAEFILESEKPGAQELFAAPAAAAVTTTTTTEAVVAPQQAAPAEAPAVAPPADSTAPAEPALPQQPGDAAVEGDGLDALFK